jgi:hypothetical protein
MGRIHRRLLNYLRRRLPVGNKANRIGEKTGLQDGADLQDTTIIRVIVYILSNRKIL